MQTWLSERTKVGTYTYPDGTEGGRGGRGGSGAGV